MSAHIAIPRDHVSLIITEGAEFVTRNDAAFKAWITEFKEENLLENLPTVKVKVKRTGEFKDRPAEEVLNKTYTFDLSAP